MSRFKVVTLLSTTLAALSIGCGSDPVAAPNTAAVALPANLAATEPPAVAAQAAPVKKDKATPTAGSVHIEDRILKVCGDIPRARFAFDSSEVEPEATKALEALARCFTTGPLAGKGMKLVGHADPRGETEYNFGLGQKRAGNVADFLGKKGLEKSRLETSSRGEIEASGVDEEGWAQDRKVDVYLAD
ncbi:OmpA family protein [Polyangium spumosum]|uniref:OmpA family protein n=1 Tax=Polyangium spumosum TaxID=889282 RepID=A0A6N7PS08_9BACT|nr:OmpA family protein [Polyangium spumosum]MRG93015.1 OmpA family protein [Polyangium spumosum]